MLLFAFYSIPSANFAQSSKKIAEQKVNTNSQLFKTSSNWIGRGGVWDFSKKTIKARGTRDSNKAYLKNTNFHNFVYEVQMRKTGESGPYGLVFHYNKKLDEGYYLLLFPNGGLGIQKFKQETVKYITRSYPTELHSGINAWNNVKLICRDSSFQIWINGVHSSSIMDDTYFSGKIGLFINGDPRQTADFIILSLKELN